MICFGELDISYRYQFILEQNWYNHLLSQVHLTDPLKITDTYIYKWSKKARNQRIELWLCCMAYCLHKVRTLIIING